MLDHFVIFRKNGLVLWSKTFTELEGNPIERLISDVLLEERSSDCSYTMDDYQLRWTFANELDLVFVAVYQKLFQLLYVEELLERVKKTFVRTYQASIRTATAPVDFGDQFTAILEDAEMSHRRRKGARRAKPKAFEETSRGKEVSQNKGKKKKGKKGAATNAGGGSSSESGSEEEEEDGGEEEEAEVADNDPVDSNNADSDGPLSSAEIRRRIAQRRKQGRGGKAAGKDRKDGEEGRSKKRATAGAPIDTSRRIKKKHVDALDYTRKTGGATAEEAAEASFGSAYNEGESLVERSEEGPWEETTEGDKGKSGSKWGLGSLVGGWIDQVSGNKVLERADVEPVMQQLRERLIGKNVAREVAEDLCESVANKLVGQKLASFTRVSTAVEEALEEALRRILTPKKSVDTLRAAMLAKEEGRPFSIVFVGVNGVGKSTSLSKVCYYLRQKNLSVLIAACDTFRSGAVEQLRVHANRLGVQVFSQGYAKDPSAVAGAAMQHAAKYNIDCVLIDTAGRMQNNTSLMKALATLVVENQPDQVLFVGEALVGNDGVDQLLEFNGALSRESERLRAPRSLDGIVLTKFDTIDDKVGAAVGMVYKTSQPIMFVGTGQKYTHLRRLNVGTVIRSLMS